MKQKISIAIDGPVASGKTTVGRLLAQKIGFQFIDTGLMYRAVTWAAISKNLDIQEVESLTTLCENLNMIFLTDGNSEILLVNGEDVTDRLRDPIVESKVSLVSKLQDVRKILVKHQQDMAKEISLVMVGRDIGTVVLPNADYKIYLDAAVLTRAKRRYIELAANNSKLNLKSVVEDISQRDKIDIQRKESPLRASADSIKIRTDNLTVDEVVRSIIDIVG